jgi:phospholipid transport system transporter-binding protein
MSSDTDGTLILSGQLTLDTVAEQLGSISGHPDAIDLSAVERIDTAGVALVAELVSRIERARGKRPEVRGNPEGLDALCRAYRIEADFTDFP